MLRLVRALHFPTAEGSERKSLWISRFFLVSNSLFWRGLSISVVTRILAGLEKLLDGLLSTLNYTYFSIRPYCFPYNALLELASLAAWASFKESHPAVQCLRGEGTIPRGGSALKKQHAEHLRSIPFLTFGFSLVLLFACLTSLAQTASPITSSGLNTRVSPPSTLPSGKVQYDITVGPGREVERICSIASVTSMFPTTTSQTFSITPAWPHRTSSVVSRAETSPTSLERSRPPGLGTPTSS